MTTDMSHVIQPKSDQINADDFISGPATYMIEGVSISPGTEQPVSIRLAGEPRVWRPCKSASRCLVAAWGPDAKEYTGRRLTLYRDPKVKWGGMEVGGIRISHLSHIDREMVIALTATKGKKAVTTIKPLVAEVVKPAPTLDLLTWADRITAALPSYATVAAMKAEWDVHKVALKDAHPDRFTTLNKAVIARAGELSVEE